MKQNILLPYHRHPIPGDELAAWVTYPDALKAMDEYRIAIIPKIAYSIDVQRLRATASDAEFRRMFMDMATRVGDQ